MDLIKFKFYYYNLCNLFNLCFLFYPQTSSDIFRHTQISSNIHLLSLPYVYSCFLPYPLQSQIFVILSTVIAVSFIFAISLINKITFVSSITRWNRYLKGPNHHQILFSYIIDLALLTM